MYLHGESCKLIALVTCHVQDYCIMKSCFLCLNDVVNEQENKG